MTICLILDLIGTRCIQVYPEGTHFVIPWFERQAIYDVRPRPSPIECTSASKDLQMVNIISSYIACFSFSWFCNFGLNHCEINRTGPPQGEDVYYLKCLDDSSFSKSKMCIILILFLSKTSLHGKLLASIILEKKFSNICLCSSLET